jgi:hypothetical protein
MCGNAGVEYKGRDTAATGGLQAPGLAAAGLDSYRPAAGLGLSTMSGVFDPADSSVCAGNADVQSCFVQQGAAVAATAGPDLVEWDSWYAGLASLVE